MVISEDTWHSLLLPSVSQWSCHCLFYELGLSRLGFEHPTFRMRGERAIRPSHRGGIVIVLIMTLIMLITLPGNPRSKHRWSSCVSLKDSVHRWNVQSPPVPFFLDILPIYFFVIAKIPHSIKIILMTDLENINIIVFKIS